jgi:chorismate mutase
MMQVRGIRGAITVQANTAGAILEATRRLLEQMVAANSIDEADVASVFFTTTPELTAAFPAKAARDMGWTRVALMGASEAAVSEGIPMCIRVLIHWNTTKGIDEIKHIYMRDAQILRPDFYPDHSVYIQNGDGEGS